MASQPGKPVRLSHVATNELVRPLDTNVHGTIFGGRVVSLMDVTCAIAAARHSRSSVVTVAIDEVHFLSPVKLGFVVNLMASVNYTARTSMEVGVRVESENPLTGERTHTASAYFTFVALDAEGRPTEVPPVLPETPTEERRYREAAARRAQRLHHREERLKARAAEPRA